MTTKRMTPKDFAPHLLAVLAELTEYEANISVPMEETFKPTCDRMGIDETYGGETSHGSFFTHRTIGLAFRQQIRGKGLGDQAKRGHWMLTQAGVNQARENAGLDPVAPSEKEEVEEEMLTAARADAAEETDDEKDAEVLHLPVPGVKHPYSDDAYIRSLAIESVSCFGAWSSRSEACKDCPIASDCTLQVGVHKAELAANLQAEEEEQLVRQKAKAEAAAKKNESVSELVSKMSQEDAATRGGTKGKFKPTSGQDFADAKASRETVCIQCGEKIYKGDPIKWCSGEGIFHTACFQGD